jgi:acetylornithine deacetylase/succinyl-diaminopimelate desuccinylase-like protein
MLHPRLVEDLRRLARVGSLAHCSKDGKGRVHGGRNVNTELQDLLENLIAIDSQNPGAGEAEIARYVDELARNLDFDSQIVDTAPGRSNVLVTADAGGPKVLAFSGHLDTKPVGDAISKWDTLPLELHVRDGLAYGLGTSDMKGAIACMLVAAQRWAQSASSGRLELIFTADEEAGSEYGAKALCDQGLVEADALIIGEPSGISEPWEAIFLVSRGICCFDVVIEGTQGHSGLSERLPTSATVAAAEAILALHNDLELSFEPHPDYDYRPTFNAGVRIEGGVFYAVHPGHATVSCDIRLVPGMQLDQLDRQIREALTNALPKDVDWHLRYRKDQLGWMEPVAIDPGHEVVAAAQAGCEEALGRHLPYAAYPGGTDATSFISMAGIPTIASLGPGWLSVAHGPNECVGLDQLEQATVLYEAIARRFLKT